MILKNPTKYLYIFWIVIFLILDFSIGTWYQHNRDFNSFRTKDRYFHHGLLPNEDTKHLWGDRKYSFVTNSLGMKDAVRREIPLKSNQKRIVFIGDSFTESVGYTFNESFVGLLNERALKKNIEILNAGVESYSPKLYYLKIRYLIEQVGLNFDELVVMLDLSDIQDEITYENFSSQLEQMPGSGRLAWQRFLDQVHHYFRKHSMLYLTIYKKKSRTYNRQNQIKAKSYQWENIGSYYQERNMWTYNDYVFAGWGQKGIKLAKANMVKLIELCRKHNIKLSLVIYPWPRQINQQDLEAKQVQIWEAFAKEYNVDFINLFPAFINEQSPKDVIHEFFVAGDFHWNSNGHRMIAERLYKSIL